ncbi:hypothetical protein GQX74_002690 [Glossina fuscipes]|nr:hypothetical protein GQX74_002690 [Glossina fuscipes]
MTSAGGCSGTRVIYRFEYEPKWSNSAGRDEPSYACEKNHQISNCLLIFVWGTPICVVGFVIKARMKIKFTLRLRIVDVLFLVFKPLIRVPCKLYICDNGLTAINAENNINR